MSSPIVNPFDAPLQGEQQAAAQPQLQPAGANPFDAPLTSENTSGQVTNDVGNAVIVPKPGESFSDTMNRAAAYGKNVTQGQIDKETATAPRKAAEVMAAAPVIGAAGSAALVGAGQLPGVAERVFQFSEDQLAKFAEAYPHLAKLAKKFGMGAGATGAYELYRRLTGGH